MSVKNLTLIALCFILLSSISGGIFAFKVEQETLLLLREQYQAAFAAAMDHDIQAAQSHMREAQQQNFRYVRIIDAHTHYIKLSILLLLAGFLLLSCDWQRKSQLLVLSAMVAGIVLFPTSVYLQTLSPGILFQCSAAAGALLIITSTAFIVAALFKKQRTTERSRQK